MLSRQHRVVVVFLAVAGLLCVAGVAQEPKRDRSGGYAAILDNLDMLVDNYAKFLGRKYDLTEEQYNFTVDMLRQKANDFIAKHDGDIRDLFEQMFDARAGGTMSPEELVEWGKRVTPIYEEAKKIVTDGNEEWRSILDDRQKGIHDSDLKLMKTSFQTTDEQLHRIVTGEMSVDEFVNPNKYNRGPRRAPKQPVSTTPDAVDPAHGDPGGKQVATASNVPAAQALPKGDGSQTPEEMEEHAKLEAIAAEKHAADEAARRAAEEQNGQAPPPEGGEVAPPPAPAPEGGQPMPPPTPGERPRDRGGKVSAKNFESEWQKYVREFIERYQLNESQTQKANLFLDEAERRAQQAVGAKQDELAKIDKRESELKGSAAARGKDSPSAKELEELAKKREAIVAPLSRIFDDLKSKLDKLPTRAQRKAAEEASKKPARPPAKPGGPPGKASDKPPR